MTTLSDIQRAQRVLDTILNSHGPDNNYILNRDAVNQLQEVIWVLDDFVSVHQQLDKMNILRFATNGDELTILQRIEWALEDFRHLMQRVGDNHFVQSTFYHVQKQD